MFRGFGLQTAKLLATDGHARSWRINDTVPRLFLRLLVWT